MNIELFRNLNSKGLATIEMINRHFQHQKKKSFMNKLQKVIDEKVMNYQRFRFVYRDNEGVILSKCSYCGHIEEIKRVPKQKTWEECNKCGSNLETRNVKYSNFSQGSYREFVTFENSSMCKDIIVGYQVGVYRRIVENGMFPKIEDEIKILGKSLFDSESKNRLIERYYYWSSSDSKETLRASVHTIGYANTNFTGYDTDSLDRALRKSNALKYFTGIIPEGGDKLKVLDAITRNIKLELLIKVGLGGLIVSRFTGNATRSTIDWNGKTLFKMLKLSRHEFKELKSAEKYSIGFYELYVTQQLAKHQLDIKSEYESAEYALKHCDPTILKADKPSKIIKYIENQTTKNKGRYHSSKSALMDFSDMIKDMLSLGMEINKDTIYPKDLNKAHIEIAKMVKIKADEKIDKAIAKRAQMLEKYNFEKDGFVIFPAKCTQELIDESKQLDHCVKNYAEKYAKGNCSILFIRESAKINQPLYTLELNENFKRIQCRGKRNKDVSENKKAYQVLMDFETELGRRLKDEHRVAN
jgi:hypothetical protein